MCSSVCAGYWNEMVKVATDMYGRQLDVETVVIEYWNYIKEMQV
jgi:hypothetical protein